MEQDADAAMHLLQSAGIAAGVVQTGKDMAENDPHLRDRGIFQQVPDAGGVLRTIERAPYKLTLTPGEVIRGAPEFGADQDFVLERSLASMTKNLPKWLSPVPSIRHIYDCQS